MVSILVSQCQSKERLNRLTAITWLSEFIELGGDSLLPFYPFAPPGSVAVLTSGGSVQSLSVPDAHGTVTASLAPILYSRMSPSGSLP